MLKRNGQLCRHRVPDFPGRLTDSELNAYQSAFADLENIFDEFAALAKSINSLDTEAVSRADNSQMEFAEINGVKWRVNRQLSTGNLGDVFLCKLENQKEFAIVERFDADSPFAKVNGTYKIHQTGNDARQLLADYRRAERQTLKFLADDLSVDVREHLCEKYSSPDAPRICRALTARFNKEFSDVAPKQARVITRSIKIGI